MKEYRICENLHGKFKIQYFKTTSILGRILWQRWVDGCFSWGLDRYVLKTFDSYEKAEEQIQKFKDEDAKRAENNGKEWRCMGVI